MSETKSATEQINNGKRCVTVPEGESVTIEPNTVYGIGDRYTLNGDEWLNFFGNFEGWRRNDGEIT